MNHHPLSARAALCASAALGLLAAATPAWAEDAAASDAGDASIIVTGQREAVLKEEADTGSRLGLTALETPASVNTVIGDDIRARGDFSVQGAVSRAPGVTNASNPGNAGSSYTMRGFSGATSVLQLYDGVRLYPVADSISFPSDPWNIERIEVLSGPASVLYGQGALGGAVNVIPKGPNADRYEFEGEAGYGSDSTWHVAGGAGGPLGDTLSFRADASYRKSDGWVDRGDNHSLALSGALRYQPTETLTVTLRDDYGNIHPQKYFGTPLIDGAIDKSIRHNNYNVGDAIMQFRDNRTILDIDWQVAEGLKFRSTNYYMTSKRMWQNLEIYCWIGADGLCPAGDGYGYGTPGNIYRSDNYGIVHDQKQYGTLTSFNVTFPVGGSVTNSLLFGVDLNRSDLVYSHDFDTDFQESEVPVNGFDPGTFLETSVIKPRYHTRTDTFAVFAEDRLGLGDKFSIVGGARIEYNKTFRWNYVYSGDEIVGEAPALDIDPDTGLGRAAYKSLQHTTWRVGAVYQPTESLSLYAQYATAVDPIGGLTTYSGNAVTYQMTNANGRQFEAGVKGIFLGGKGQFTLAAYQIDKFHMFSQQVNNGPITQIGHRRSRGVEASLAVDLPAGFAINANGTILNADADLDDGNRNPSPGIPQQSANLELSWSGIDKLQLRGNLRYVGKRYTEDDKTFPVPAYTVVDLSATYALTRNVGLDVRLYNLFDKAYAEGVYFDQQWILGRPRSFDVSVRAAF
ncbi:MAG: TonB-dependent receptor [Candidatus Andeanibacterium colombiense]|uniref:TonB-dependent receptor n=1 Tax=Candidatus Andeanibacterium colombiense TaxID=3121345 RepID=A0AAJ6BQ15_9SPHN|nr:MAG: TonB-dependent receptor [Sphingomonadaceae bacterium]